MSEPTPRSSSDDTGSPLARHGWASWRTGVASAVAGNPVVQRATTYREVEIVALAAHDRDHATAFVASTLGPLAADNAQAARLRETLRAYLHDGSRAPRTAHRLNTHRNTILHRVARAEELLGHPLEEHRLELALALELAHWLGVRPASRHERP